MTCIAARPLINFTKINYCAVIRTDLNIDLNLNLISILNA
jgi:hypothetical protein